MEANADIHQGLLDQTNRILHGPIRLGDKRGRESPRSGFHADRGRDERPGIAFEQGIDLEERDPFAVDRDLQFLTLQRFGQISSDKLAQIVVVEIGLEGVFAVGRKMMNHRGAAACAKRRAFDVAHLVDDLGHVVLDHHRRRVRVAERLPRHLVGGANYACINAGFTVSASAMLSKAPVRESGGSKADTSTSMPSTSRIALRYSRRLMRCSSGAL